MKKLILLMAVLFCGNAFAANEIHVNYTTGRTLYSVVMQDVTFKVWDGDSFETTPAAWTDCDIAMTEHAFVKGFYTGTFPAAAAAGRYIVFTFIGPAAADTDTMVKVDYYNWSGTAETSFANFAEIIKDIFLGGDQTPITMVSGKAKAIVGAVAN